MPVALTYHIDRSKDKQLLRGRAGIVHSCILLSQETSKFVQGVRVLRKLPKVVMVNFRNANGTEVKWRLPGLQENGLYPIVPKRGTWFLDKGRQNPILRITRAQLPPAPAFAMTSHAAQGQTLHQGAIVDLSIGHSSNPLGSYIAMTRVSSRSKLLIYRPFPREPYTRKSHEGPDLLLRHLRGDVIDWAEIEAKYTPKKRCAGCSFVQSKTSCTPLQWNRKDDLSFCQDCLIQKKKMNTPMRFNACGLWGVEDAFPAHYLHPMALSTRVCEHCIVCRQCGTCGLF